MALLSGMRPPAWTGAAAVLRRAHLRAQPRAGGRRRDAAQPSERTPPLHSTHAASPWAREGSRVQAGIKQPAESRHSGFLNRLKNTRHPTHRSPARTRSCTAPPRRRRRPPPARNRRARQRVGGEREGEASAERGRGGSCTAPPRRRRRRPPPAGASQSSELPRPAPRHSHACAGHAPAARAQRAPLGSAGAEQAAAGPQRTSRRRLLAYQAALPLPEQQNKHLPQK